MTSIRFKRTLVTLFILLNFMMMVRHLLPIDQSKILTTLFKPATIVQSGLSLYQGWEMFAPNPSKLTSFMTAEIEFDDKKVETWNFPRSSELNVFQKYIYGEKYRKIVSEGIRKDDHNFMWADAARFVLRKNRDRFADKIPVRVRLIRHWSETPDLNVAFIPHRKPNPKTESFMFYTYEVFK